MKAGKDNSWISFSDIMTGLMVIFMFIAIAYIMEVRKEQNERDNLFKQFKATKESLFNELDSAFHDDFQNWKVELDKDLSIKFTNPDVLFESGETEIRKQFADILNDFLPAYCEIVLQEKYEEKIAEIRIEGHTDTVPAWSYDVDPYIGNVKLSQGRSAEVLKFLRNTAYYDSLDLKSESRLQFWLTANGLSYGKTIDKNKVLTFISGEDPNNELSRRVEFRIVTSSEALVDKILEELSRDE